METGAGEGGREVDSQSGKTSADSAGTSRYDCSMHSEKACTLQLGVSSLFNVVVITGVSNHLELFSNDVAANPDR